MWVDQKNCDSWLATYLPIERVTLVIIATIAPPEKFVRSRHLVAVSSTALQILYLHANILTD